MSDESLERLDKVTGCAYEKGIIKAHVHESQLEDLEVSNHLPTQRRLRH